jgi:hypothetical protein
MASQAHAKEAAGAEDHGFGWLTFAAVMLGFAGVYAVIEGILAISRSKIFVGDAKYVFSDLRAWGVIVLILGILALLSTWWLWQGSEFAKWFGILVAGINGLGQLLFVNSSPFWSLAIFACNVLVIYALARYGGETARRYAE